ncbi:MAG: amidase [Alphaproteobacteria bacterium]|nr:amidase [Alphaproteobacteria bacterium]
MRLKIILAAASAAVAGAAHAQPVPLIPYASGAEAEAAMRAGRITSEALVRADLARIQEIDKAGPKLNSVIAVNPQAIAEARAADAERRAGHVASPLLGLPVLIKDNIEARGMATTAGSLALKDNVTDRDAPLVARLRAAGAVILGKTNLSEWANFRSDHSVSGWSAVGGLVRNPHELDRTACGSSAGTGAAVAAGLASLGVGTETDGSITCPSTMNGIVGLKPTVGLVSRRYIVPISPEQDTAGPMTRTVEDAAAMLSVMAGSDPGDPATQGADAHKSDYLARLKPNALQGVRVGVLHEVVRGSPGTEVAFEAAQAALKRAGAILVDVKLPPESVLNEIGRDEGEALESEFKAAIDSYLASTPPAVKTRSLEALIAFDKAEPREMALFGQELFEASAKAPPVTDPAYIARRARIRALARAAIDKMLADNQVQVLVSPTGGPASVVDPVNGGRFFGSPTTLPAVSGYPHLTVPMGAVKGLPVGLSFVGTAWSEARLLAYGYAFEQQTHARRDPGFVPTVGARPEIVAAYDPR